MSPELIIMQPFVSVFVWAKVGLRLHVCVCINKKIKHVSIQFLLTVSWPRSDGQQAAAGPVMHGGVSHLRHALQSTQQLNSDSSHVNNQRHHCSSAELFTVSIWHKDKSTMVPCTLDNFGKRICQLFTRVLGAVCLG